MQNTHYISPNSYIQYKETTLRYLESKEGIEAYSLINKFYDLYVEGQYAFFNPVPDFNPWKLITFKTGKALKELYSDWGKLGSRSFFISNRMLDMLQALSVAEHVSFSGIKYFNGTETKNDLNWIFFYVDYYQYMDYSRSEFVLYDREKSIGNDLVILDTLFFNDKESVDKYEKELQNTNFSLFCPRIYLKVPREIDFFPIFEISNSFYCSYRFMDVYKKNKMKGIDFPNRPPKVILL